MNAANILAWSLQIAALVAVAALAAALLQLKVPRARLLYWQVALAACMALPLVRPWTQEVTGGDVSVTTVAVARATGAPAGFHVTPREAVLWLIAIGIGARVLWLAIGFWRLRCYRRRSRLWDTREGATLLLSDDISSPVTFGALRPVVLLPAGFPDLDANVREAVLCHELLHVERRDWVFTVAEELVRAAWWFHPAVWWLLGQIQLAREQTVDRAVVERTQAREEYIDSLLAMAGATPRLDLAPAPLFLRQRHLKQRVVSLVKEVRMSKTRLVSSMAAALSVLAAACWLVTAAFPLRADAVADAPGVTVDLRGATLLHRAPVTYPESARRAGVQGTVVVQFQIDSSGEVSDAQVLSGPEELRKAALQSVLDWHFTRDQAGNMKQVAITFNLGAAFAPLSTPLPAPPVALNAQLPIKSITVTGLSDTAQTDLLSRLPVHEGDTLSPETMSQLVQTVKSFDEHLAVRAIPSNGEAIVRIALPQTTPVPAAQPAGLARIRVGGEVQAVKLIDQPKPAYPPLAKQARIQGVVKLNAVIAKDGTVKDLSVISGHPLLVASAIEAVKQWVYQTTLLNGEPVEVVTEIDVNFTLSQ